MAEQTPEVILVSRVEIEGLRAEVGRLDEANEGLGRALVEARAEVERLRDDVNDWKSWEAKARGEVERLRAEDTHWRGQSVRALDAEVARLREERDEAKRALARFTCWVCGGGPVTAHNSALHDEEEDR